MAAVFGASETDLNEAREGALRGILQQTAGGSANADKAIALAQQLYPDTPKADPYEAAFQFFAEMGRQASQPGATVLGSAVGSMQVPMDYLNAKKKEAEETERARMTTALSLGPSLKPKEKTAAQLNYKSVMITKPDGTQYEDYIPTSQIAVLQKEGFKVLAKPTNSTATFKRTVYKPDGSKREVYSQAEFNSATGSVTDENPSGGWSTTQPASTSSQSSALTNYKFASPEALAKFKAKYPDIILTPDQEAGNQPLGLPNAISNDPDLLGVFSKFSEPKSGTLYERLFASVNEIGTRLSDPNLAPLVSQQEKNEYAANYQKLIVGGEFTEIVDGKEVTRRRPGIDLSETTNLPVPEGLDLDAIIEERSQKFDQNQNTSATFGSRMLYNEGVLRNVLADGYVLSLSDIAQIRAMQRLGLGNIGIDPQAQQFHVAAQNWVAAQLRNESGAAIAPSEYADALLQYFPKVGDDAETIKQKQALREEATKGMINSAGDAFKVVYPNGQQYLTYTSDGETYDILNPQGYANELLAKTELGQNLFFKDTIRSKTTTDLRNMLANPNAANLYTEQMIDMIAEELASREN